MPCRASTSSIRCSRTHERTCPHHGVELERFGEVVSEQLDVIPATRSGCCATCAASTAARTCEGHLRTAPMPAQPLPKSLASPGLLAFIVATAKYADALPLYRQHQQLKRIGVDLSRTTLATVDGARRAHSVVPCPQPAAR